MFLNQATSTAGIPPSIVFDISNPNVPAGINTVVQPSGGNFLPGSSSIADSNTNPLINVQFSLANSTTIQLLLQFTSSQSLPIDTVIQWSYCYQSS